MKCLEHMKAQQRCGGGGGDSSVGGGVDVVLAFCWHLHTGVTSVWVGWWWEGVSTATLFLFLLASELIQFAAFSLQPRRFASSSSQRALGRDLQKVSQSKSP